MYEFFFKYPRAVYEDSSLILLSDWPLWLMIAGFAAFAIGLLFMLGWQRKLLSPLQLAGIGVLQLLMLAVVLIMLWQPALVSERLVQGENTLAIMLDTSSSMALSDGGSSRMNQALDLLDGNGLRPLAQIYDILPYSFAANASPLESFDELPPPVAASRLGESVLQTLRLAGNTSLGAVILISDGADNSGAISQAQLNEIASFGIPVHTVGIGSEVMPDDLELAALQLPEKALPGTILSAGVSIRHDRGGNARVRVYDGDDFISMHDIALEAGRTLTTAFIDIEVAEPGQMDLRFSIDPLDNESYLANNSRAQVVDVPDGRYRIMYMEGEPRWEYKFIQRALDDDPSVQLSTLLRVSTNKYYRQGIDGPEELADGFPTLRSELYRYDALVIGSVDLGEFSEEQQQLIYDFVSERGGSLLMIAGLDGLGQGGWGASVVSDTLPARLPADNAQFVRRQVPVSLNPNNINSPILQLSSDVEVNRQLWDAMPAVADYQAIGSLRPAASTLLDILVDGERKPLLVTQPYGRGQTYILATGGTWRWQMSMPSDDASHETFWRQLARALVVNSPLPFELSSSVESGDIHIRARIRDPEAEENQGLAISAVVTSASDEPLTIEMQPLAGRPGVYEAAFTPAAPGLYSIEAISRIGNNPLAITSTAIRFDEGQEAFNIRQNRALLEQLASSTGGRYWTPAQWQQLPDAVALSSAGITEQHIRQLWDAPLFFFLLILLKTSEWLLRRRWRTI